MAEVITIPRVRTSSTAIQSPISKCGDNWWRDIRIRSPYKGVDGAFRTLPSLGDPEQLESLDPNFPEEIRADADRISKFISEHAGDLSDLQRTNIDIMIRRALNYLSDAIKIQKLWSSGFSITGQASVPPWPLHAQPLGLVNGNIEEGHHRDSSKWKRLILATLKNLRCAEEVAKRATVRQYNKESHVHGRRFGANVPSLKTGKTSKATPLLQKPKTMIPSLSAVPGVSMPPMGADLDPGEPPLPEEAIEETFESEPETAPQDQDSVDVPKVSAPVKKKDNSILIVGAAALSLLAFSKGKR